MKTIQEEEEEEKTLRTIEMLDIRNVYRTPQETILCSVSNPQSILFFLYILFFAHTFLSKGWREHQPSFCFSLMLSDTCELQCQLLHALHALLVVVVVVVELFLRLITSTC